MQMGLLALFFLSFLLALSNATEISKNIGISYGQLGNNLPSPSQSIKLLQGLKAGKVKLYDADPEILNALSGTKIEVIMMVPNELIPYIFNNQTFSDEWVRANVLPFYPKTKIRHVLVGNEILSIWSSIGKKGFFQLVPAMRRIRRSLKTLNLKNIRVGTPLAVDCIDSVSQPSNGTFRSDISVKVMKPMLQFLKRTKSVFFIDAYTYFTWAADPAHINLDYALLRGNLTYTDPVSGLSYTNLLDQIIDSVVFAMTKLGFPNIPIVIAETGWPSKGDIDQIGANIYNAATYNRNLVRKMTSNPPIGTPARPGWVIPTIIFALYNENQKGGPGTERNWGLLYPNGSHVYDVDLTGKQPLSDYSPLPAATNNKPYKGKIWCVAAAKKEVNVTELRSAMNTACGQINRTCDDMIRPGKECYKPTSLTAHASYVFNSYWVKFRSSGATCFFNGLAVQTTQDPSHGSCRFPSVTV